MIRSIGGHDSLEAPNRFEPPTNRFLGLALVLLFLISPVAGATVTIVPRSSLSNPGVTIKTQYGYLNSTNQQTFNAFTVYANGTIFFDVTGTTGTMQGTYFFQSKSFGNGTMQLRFLGPIPQSVTTTGVASYSNFPNNWEQIQYSTSQTSQLIVVYAPILVFGVVNGSIFYQVIVIASAIMYLSMFFGLFMRIFLKKKDGFILVDTRLIILSGLVGTIGFLFILIVGANLVKPACPPGYTCVG